MKRLTLAALGFVLVYNLLFFQTDYGIGTGLFILLLNLFYFLFKNPESKNKSLAIVCSGVSTVFAFFLGYRANEIVRFIDFSLAIFFSTASLYFYKSSFNFSFEIPQFLLIPLIAAKNSIVGLLNVFSKEEKLENKEDGRYASLVRGVAITLPILFILLLLLTKADPIFNKLVSNLFNDIWERLFVSILVFIGLIASSRALFEKIKEEDVTQTETTHKASELLVILSGITLLFASFLIVQFNYFFSNSGERQLLELGIKSLTYSEYVRKGFFELLAASTIAAGIMLYVMRFLHKLPTSQKLWTQLLSGALVLEIGLLLLSGAQRINLYQIAHGLTRARVFGFIFLIWLGAMLVILLVRIFKEIKKEILFETFLVSTVGVLLFINFANIDGLIATKYKPSVNEEIDYYYLSYLSEDAHPAWESAILDAKNTLLKLEPSERFSEEQYRQLYWTRSTLERLDYLITYLNEKYGDYSAIKIENEDKREYITKIRKWQSFNFGEYQAYIKVLQNKGTFNQLKPLLQKAHDFDANRVPESIRNFGVLDRATEPPLL